MGKQQLVDAVQNAQEHKLAESSGEPKEFKKRVEQKDVFLKIIEDLEFWRDCEDGVYVTVEIANHLEHYEARSRPFKDWLAREFSRRRNKIHSKQALEETLSICESRARFDGSSYKTAIRVAMQEGTIYYDLCDENWHVVKITSQGWHVIPGADCPVRFIRKKGMKAAPLPEKGGSWKELFKILNVQRLESQRLIIGWLVGALNPGGSYCILKLEGEQGSGKSFASRILRGLIDPNTALVNRAARSEEDLLIEAMSAWVLAFDNQSGISEELSDGLCRLATGGGMKKRQLFTDSDLIILEARRPVILNSIDEDAGREDLRDRMVIVRLDRFDDEKAERRTESELWDQFEQAHPKILGSLLDAVCMALRNKDSVRLIRQPRMLDFATFVTAAEPALGWESGSFVRDYMANRDQSYRDHIEASPFATAVLQLVNLSGGTFCGSMSDLLERVKEKRPDGFNAWPRTASGASNTIRRLAPALRRIGYAVDFSRTSEERIVTIRKTAT